MRTVILTVLPLLAGCCCCGFPSGPAPQATTSSSPADEPADTSPARRPVTPPVEALPAIAFEEIVRDRGELFAGEALTDIQKDARWEQHEQALTRHRASDWFGYVLDAKRASFTDEPYLTLDMATAEDGEPDVYLYVSSQQAQSVGVGTAVTFSGRLRGLWPEIGRPYSVEVDCSELEVAVTAGDASVNKN